MSSRYSQEMLKSLNGIQLLTIIHHFGMDQVCNRLGIAQGKSNGNGNK